ncbi:MAG: LysR family transcriptional regulator [Caulobacteraceae bacterium]
MRYTLRQLEAFVEAARDCNFARAAGRLGISQPAISDHVSALERNLDSQLFLRRRGATPRLTMAGQRLLEDAQAILEQGSRLSEHGVGAVGAVQLRVFVGHHLFARILRAALPAFHRDHRAISLDVITEASSDNVGSLIDRGELDAAVFTAPSWSLPLNAEVLCDVPCAVAASRRLVGEAELSAADIAGLPFTLPLETAAPARWVEAVLAQAGIAPHNVIARTPFLDVQLRMVEEGMAAALLFREDIEASPMRAELRRLTPDVGGFQRVLVTRRSERRPEALAVAAFLRETIGG